MAYRILTAAALAVALAAPALAQEIRPAGPPIVLQPSAGTLIKTPAPLGQVFIANPDIASVQVPPIEAAAGKNIVYVFAKAPGKTTLFALGEDGEIMLSRVVEVPGPRTVRVLRGTHAPEIWTEAHEPSPRLSDLPAGSSVTMPVGQPR
jgi:Flp pilus assembly secretin CpaC